MDCDSQSLSSPTNGHVNSTTTFGSVATYSCDNGYRLSGQSMTICQADGTWSGSEPTCKIVDCGQLDDITNGQITQQIHTTYDSVTSYSCDNGYVLIGPNRRTCQADGTWSGSEPSCWTQPTCETVDCNRPTESAHGHLGLSTTTFGSVATYSCDNGYCLSGQSMTICQADGTWSGSTPTCAIVDCGQLDHITNGQITQPTTTYGSSATYSCNIGYRLNGPATTTCGADGYWSGNVPTCAIVDCSTPTTPTNGQASFVSINFTSVVAYSCDSGYTLSGSNSRFCQADGTWSGSEPTCAIVDCSTLTTPTNGQASFVSINFTSVVAYSCDSGYTLSGPNIRFCQADGTWSGSVSTCVKLSSTSTDASSDSGDVGGIVVGVILLVAIIAVVVLLLVIVIFVW